MNRDVQQYNIEFGAIAKPDGTYRYLNALNKESLYQFHFLRIFDNYNGPKIGMGRLAKGLYESGWQVMEVTINPKNNIYQLYSSRYNVVINLKLSTELDFQRSNITDYQDMFNILKMMSKNAKIQDNKIIQISDYKNLKVLPKARKILSKKTKIVLVTLAITATAIFTGSMIVGAMNDSSASKSDSNQTSYQQSYQESSISGVSQETFNKSIEIAKERQLKENMKNNSNQTNNANSILNQNQTYYHNGQAYYQSPIPNVSDDVYNQSIQVAQQRQSR